MDSSKNKLTKIPQQKAKPTVPVNPSQELTRQHKNDLIDVLSWKAHGKNIHLISVLNHRELAGQMVSSDGH